jgi:hypothetical protein
MDASDIIRRNLQVIKAAAKVEAIAAARPTFVANTTDSITNVGTMTFASAEAKMDFEAGMKYLSYTNGIPTVSAPNFCAARIAD